VQTLQFNVKEPTVGKSATFVKVDHVIQETKNLMNIISKVVSTCFDCANKVSGSFFLILENLFSFSIFSPPQLLLFYTNNKFFSLAILYCHTFYHTLMVLNFLKKINNFHLIYRFSPSILLLFIYLFLFLSLRQIQKKKTVVFTLSDGRWDLESIKLL
jgi:hypothetical protein